MKYYIIAGEASGDLHGSNLMNGIYAEDPLAAIRFWGGDKMDAVHRAKTRVREGSGLVHHYREGAVMGFQEVLAKGWKLLGNVARCKRDIAGWNPDVVILIDYPGFNFKIARFAHKRGLKVFYYIAPKVWASREGRIRKLRKYVDRLFIVFPFEIPYFESKNIPYIYKGNPLVDAIDNSEELARTREEFLKDNKLDDKPYIALLAGSRANEISTMMPVLREFAHKMKAIPQYSGYQFIIAGAPARSLADYTPWLSKEDRFIKVVFGQTQSIIKHAKAAVINSGTASLEAVLIGTPQVVGFRMSSLTYSIAKRIVKVKYISLGNLCIDKLAFRELIQDDCNPDALVEEVRKLVEDKEYRGKMLEDYSLIRERLGGCGASRAVAKAMITSLK